MKKIMIITTIGILAIYGFGISEEIKKGKENQHALCVQWAELAKDIMDLRQANTDITNLLKGEEESELYQKIVYMAYDQPVFSIPENKEAASIKFKNQVFRSCMGK